MSIPNRLFSRIAARNLCAALDRRLLRPAFLAGVLDLVEIHLDEQAESVLPKVHRSARGIEQGDLARRLEPLNFAELIQALVADALAGTRHEIIHYRWTAVALIGQRRRLGRPQRRVRMHL